MNDVKLKGNLARDPDVKEVAGANGTTKVANFTVATTRYFKKGDGSRGSDTTFVPCEAWDTGAESIQKLLKKGTPVLLSGSLKVESWEKDGQKHSRMKVRVKTFEKLYSSPESYQNTTTNEEGNTQSTETPAETPTEQAPEPVVVGGGEDVPF